MSFNVLNRRVHYWSSFAVAIPLLVIIATGLLLQVKKHWTWVQPPELRGTGTVPAVELADILGALQASGLAANGWDDVDRLDVRPDRGVVKVQLRDRWEVQVDLGTGDVLQSAYRRSDLIESLHDGSFFGGDWTKLGLFLPTGVALLLLWLGGMWMWWVPYAGKRRLRRRRQHPERSVPAGSPGREILLLAIACSLIACGRPHLPAIDAEPAFVPVVGHWTPGEEDGREVLTADATRWDGAPLAAAADAAQALFGITTPAWLSNVSAAGAFPLAVSLGVPSFESGTLAVDFKLLAGESDQIAGLVFDLQPTGEYLYVRYNTRDDNLALWRFAGGERHRIAEDHTTERLPLGAWHLLSLTVDGLALRAVAAGRLTLEHALDAAVTGRVGLWTKRDSVTAFANLRLE